MAPMSIVRRRCDDNRLLTTSSSHPEKLRTPVNTHKKLTTTAYPYALPNKSISKNHYQKPATPAYQSAKSKSIRASPAENNVKMAS